MLTGEAEYDFMQVVSCCTCSHNSMQMFKLGSAKSHEAGKCGSSGSRRAEATCAKFVEQAKEPDAMISQGLLQNSNNLKAEVGMITCGTKDRVAANTRLS